MQVLSWKRLGLAASVTCLGLAVLYGQTSTATSGWPYYNGDKGSKRYSPLSQIDRTNVSKLEIKWRKPAVDPTLTAAFPDLRPSPYLRATPILLNGLLYASNAVGLVEAFDPATGKSIWVQEPVEQGLRGVSGGSTRGVDSWSSADDQRIFSIKGEYLYALNAKTGKTYSDFGKSGRVSLRWQENPPRSYFNGSGPIVVGDVVVVGGIIGSNGGGDMGLTKEGTPEDIRAFDVRSGQLRWTFHVMPREGEFGLDTWGNESWRYVGNMGTWNPMSADEELGYVYVGLTAPTNSYYGGHRPGTNLFSCSIVAIDARTGKRVWHFQTVHHDLWDYDNVGAPVLGDITVDGKAIKAVMQASKTGYLFVLDRVTGQPVWPIVERAVPASEIPGEQASPTQPIPTKPPPFDRQGLTENDLIDFTPELRREALAIARQYKLGPLFTPPSLATAERKGTLSVPGTNGAGNWNTPAFDPETGMYFAVSHTEPWGHGMIKMEPPEATSEYGFSTPHARGTDTTSYSVWGPRGLPITKPPYGRITAYDMNRGELKWMVANGDGPRDHPALKGLDLPPLGIPGRATPLLTKTLFFVGDGSESIMSIAIGGSGDKFRAYDKLTGEVVWQTTLPDGSGTTSGPMTYLANGKQYIVVPIGGKNHPPEWIAYGLP